MRHPHTSDNCRGVGRRGASFAPCPLHPAERSTGSSNLQRKHISKPVLYPVAIGTLQARPVGPHSLAAAAVSPASTSGRQEVDLWDYDGTCVHTINLDGFRLFHRQSFGHRNRRTYVVVVYDAALQSCRAIEDEVERLAAGLAYAPNIRVCKLDASGEEARAFVLQNLDIKALPAVLMYPEASPGYMRLKGSNAVTCEGLLESINRCYSLTLPSLPPFRLRGDPLDQLLSTGVASGAVPPASPQKASTSSAAASRRSSSSQHTAAASTSTAVPGATAANGRGKRQAAAGTVGRLEALPQPTTTPISLETHAGYWTPARAALWSMFLVFGVLSYCWERWLADWLHERGLRERNERRKQGEHFDIETNIDDFLFLVGKDKTNVVGPLATELLQESVSFAPALAAATTPPVAAAAAEGPSEPRGPSTSAPVRSVGYYTGSFGSNAGDSDWAAAAAAQKDVPGWDQQDERWPQAGAQDGADLEQGWQPGRQVDDEQRQEQRGAGGLQQQARWEGAARRAR